MKQTHYLTLGLLSSLALVPVMARAGQDETNRLTISARLGYNISAQFKGFSLAAPPAPRRTPSQPGRPNGDLYNYDNGYVLTDISGNAGGQTWYWGYDNSASQVSGNTILFTRSTGNALPSSGSLDSDPNLGMELTFSREMGYWGKMHYGLEAALNYMNLSVQDNSSTVASIADAYPFTPGTTPPTATPANPYQGSYQGPGFVIGDTPVNSITTSIGRRRFDADIWGMRLGPYFGVPLGDRVDVSLSGGLALGLLDSESSYVQSAVPTSGSPVNTTIRAGDFDVLWGWYISGNVSVQLSKHWNAAAGLQFQDLGTYRHNLNGQQVELGLASSIFITLGVGYNF